MIPIPLLVFHVARAFGKAKRLVNLITKQNNRVSHKFMKFYTPVNFVEAIWLP